MMPLQLFQGETLPRFTNQPARGTKNDNVINDKYAAGDARIVTEQARYPLNSIPVMIASGSYDLRPDFQRRHRWNLAKKSRLIESFIMNVPIPPIFLYENKYSHYEVMDGLQRLTAIDDFYCDKYALEGLEEWSELNGRKYSHLPEQVRRGIDRRYLSSVVLLQETAKIESEAARLKQLVFERLNSGGVKLEPQETRNAIYPGPLNDLCIRLARNQNLCITWGIPETANGENSGEISDELLENESYRKMEDVELVLRFFAYRQRIDTQKGALKDYLDYFQKHGNAFSYELINNYENFFEDTIELVQKVLGYSAFWLWRKRISGWAWYARPTTVLYDPIMFVFSQNLHNKAELLEKSEDIKNALPDFYEKNYQYFEGRNTNLSNIVKRNELLTEFIRRFVKKS
ncbi:MAG: DUF262 domain-containing protein [Burkholderiaceae bacterium]|nr:DUF262 domain-containing protein [Burkholderiaceae bacterium]